MLPEEVYKRRHYGTPWLFSLIIVNAIATCLAMPSTGKCGHVNWFFWVFIVALITYNFFTIRRNREDFNKVSIISYVVFMLLLAGGVVYYLFFNGCDAIA